MVPARAIPASRGVASGALRVARAAVLAAAVACLLAPGWQRGATTAGGPCRRANHISADTASSHRVESCAVLFAGATAMGAPRVTGHLPLGRLSHLEPPRGVFTRERGTATGSRRGDGRIASEAAPLPEAAAAVAPPTCDALWQALWLDLGSTALAEPTVADTSDGSDGRGAESAATRGSVDVGADGATSHGNRGAHSATAKAEAATSLLGIDDAAVACIRAYVNAHATNPGAAASELAVVPDEEAWMPLWDACDAARRAGDADMQVATTRAASQGQHHLDPQLWGDVARPLRERCSGEWEATRGPPFAALRRGAVAGLRTALAVLDSIVEPRGLALVGFRRSSGGGVVQVVVVGGGPVGLSSAITAHAAGASVTVVEQRMSYDRDVMFDLLGPGARSSGDGGVVYADGDGDGGSDGGDGGCGGGDDDDDDDDDDDEDDDDGDGDAAMMREGRALELLEEWGVGMMRLPTWRLQASPDTREVAAASVRCADLERALLLVARLTGVVVLRGTVFDGLDYAHATGITSNAGGGTAGDGGSTALLPAAVVRRAAADSPTTHLPFHLLLACDGTHSTVRRALGVGFATQIRVPMLSPRALLSLTPHSRRLTQRHREVPGLHQATLIARFAPGVDGTCPPRSDLMGVGSFLPGFMIDGVACAFLRFFAPHCEVQVLLTEGSTVNDAVRQRGGGDDGGGAGVGFVGGDSDIGGNDGRGTVVLEASDPDFPWAVLLDVVRMTVDDTALHSLEGLRAALLRRPPRHGGKASGGADDGMASGGDADARVFDLQIRQASRHALTLPVLASLQPSSAAGADSSADDDHDGREASAAAAAWPGLVMLRGDAAVVAHYRLGLGVNAAFDRLDEVSWAVAQLGSTLRQSRAGILTAARSAAERVTDVAARLQAVAAPRVASMVATQLHAMWHESYCERWVHHDGSVHAKTLAGFPERAFERIGVEALVADEYCAAVSRERLPNPFGCMSCGGGSGGGSEGGSYEEGDGDSGGGGWLW